MVHVSNATRVPFQVLATLIYIFLIYKALKGNQGRGEEKNIFPFQDSADVMFNSALLYEVAVLKVYAEPLLFQIPRDSAEYLEAKRLLKFLDYFLPLPTEGIAQSSLVREFVGGSCFNV